MLFSCHIFRGPAIIDAGEFSDTGDDSMARGEVILRQWNLLKMLQTRGEGIPLRQLADEFGVTERTIQWDFEVLEELGFPLEHETDDYGKRFWRMPHDFFRTGPLVLSLTEAVSLHLAEKLFMPLAGTHFAEGLRSVLENVRRLVPEKALEYFSELDETLYVRRIGVTDYSTHAEKVRVLADAARAERCVEMTYCSVWRGAEYATLCDPYGLVYYEGDLFLVGRSDRVDDIRLFKVPRIASVAATTETFERPADFRLQTHFEDCFGIMRSGAEPLDIVVRFTGPGAALVEERDWHGSQELSSPPAEATLFDENTDETQAIIARFRLSNVVEFKRWLKGFGDQAELLRPDWLRRELHDELLAAAAKHADIR